MFTNEQIAMICAIYLHTNKSSIHTLEESFQSMLDLIRKG